ncbi:MAG: ABC transporter ATP-binding protein [Elusimicrobia bacterium]|nr:ABC transporter ATP-binding protein [Elusimicrobiota bacterium]
MIELDGVSKSYGGVMVLDALSLSVPPGAFMVLEGPNGSGKTTLLEVVAGVLEPDAGTVRVGGEPMDGVSPAERGVFYIPQTLHKFWALKHESQHCFIPRLSVMENLMAAVTGRGEGELVDAASAAARIEECLTRLRLEEHAEAQPSKLSYGLQQRVALARALLLKPRVLLLDEGFSALDAGVRAEVLRIVRGIPERTGAAVVYVSHLHEEARAMADVVYRMEGGKARRLERGKAGRRDGGSPAGGASLRERIRERLGDFRAASRGVRERMIGEAALPEGWRPELHPGFEAVGEGRILEVRLVDGRGKGVPWKALKAAIDRFGGRSSTAPAVYVAAGAASASPERLRELRELGALVVVTVAPGEPLAALAPLDKDRLAARLALRPGGLGGAIEAVDGLSRMGFAAVDLACDPEASWDREGVRRLGMFMAAFSHYCVKRVKEDGRMPFFVASLRQALARAARRPQGKERPGAAKAFQQGLLRLALHLRREPGFVESYVDRGAGQDAKARARLRELLS